MACKPGGAGKSPHPGGREVWLYGSSSIVEQHVHNLDVADEADTTVGKITGPNRWSNPAGEGVCFRKECAVTNTKRGRRLFLSRNQRDGTRKSVACLFSTDSVYPWPRRFGQQDPVLATFSSPLGGSTMTGPGR